MLFLVTMSLCDKTFVRHCSFKTTWWFCQTHNQKECTAFQILQYLLQRWLTNDSGEHDKYLYSGATEIKMGFRLGRWWMYMTKNNKPLYQFTPGLYVACLYDGYWWLAVVLDISGEYQDINVKFMHPHGLTRKFQWPQNLWPVEHPQEISSSVAAAADVWQGQIHSGPNFVLGLQLLQAKRKIYHPCPECAAVWAWLER